MSGNNMWLQLLADLRATTALEVVAVITGIIYVVLIVRRQRAGWIAGAVSSAIYVWLAARAKLPVQSALQAYYVLMAVYGWFSWTRNQQQEQGRVHRWPWWRHATTVVVIMAIAMAGARVLARETQAAWPMLDALSSAASLVATWMVARSILENWLYWIAADAVMIFLFLQQGHPLTAALFAAYLIAAIIGFCGWLRFYRQQRP